MNQSHHHASNSDTDNEKDILCFIYVLRHRHYHKYRCHPIHVVRNRLCALATSTPTRRLSQFTWIWDGMIYPASSRRSLQIPDYMEKRQRRRIARRRHLGSEGLGKRISMDSGSTNFWQILVNKNCKWT